MVIPEMLNQDADPKKRKKIPSKAKEPPVIRPADSPSILFAPLRIRVIREIVSRPMPMKPKIKVCKCKLSLLFEKNDSMKISKKGKLKNKYANPNIL